jgi:hypothetical protein
MSARGHQHDDAPTVSLAAVPAEQAPARPLTCASCGAALVSDQRYCLSCGEPASPVRLAFLDVLESEQSRRNGAQRQQLLAAGGYPLAPAGWAPQEPEHGAGGWLRRNSALLSLLSLLVLCLIAGLLVGHWASASKASNGPQVIKVEGLGALSNAGSTAPSSTAGAAGAKHSSSAAKEEAEESAEAAKETKAEKAPPPKPVKIAPSRVQKLTHSTGRKHQEEINSLGAQPIETG